MDFYLFFLLTIFLIGFIAFIVNLVMLKQRYSPVLFRFLVLLGVLTIKMAANSIIPFYNYYDSINSNHKLYVVSLASNIAADLLIFCIPWFLIFITNLSLKLKKVLVFWGIISTLSVIFTIIRLFIPHGSLGVLSNLAIAAAFYYSVFIGLKYLDKVKIPKLKHQIKPVLLIAAALSPFILFDAIRTISNNFDLVFPSWHFLMSAPPFVTPVLIVLFILYFEVFFLGDFFRNNYTAVGLLKSAAITSREKEVINLVVQGYSNRLLADKLGIKESTVKKHLYNVYNKLGIDSRFDLIRLLS